MCPRRRPHGPHVPRNLLVRHPGRFPPLRADPRRVLPPPPDLPALLPQVAPPLWPGLPPKATRAHSQTSAVPAPQTTTTPRFLPVHLRAQELSQANDHEGTSSATVPLELVLPSNCRILVRPGFDPRCLRQLLVCLDGRLWPGTFA